MFFLPFSNTEIFQKSSTAQKTISCLKRFLVKTKLHDFRKRKRYKRDRSLDFSPSFSDHLISPVCFFTACIVPSNVETNRKDSGTLKVRDCNIQKEKSIFLESSQIQLEKQWNQQQLSGLPLQKIPLKATLKTPWNYRKFLRSCIHSLCPSYFCVIKTWCNNTATGISIEFIHVNTRVPVVRR